MISDNFSFIFFTIKKEEDHHEVKKIIGKEVEKGKEKKRKRKIY